MTNKSFPNRIPYSHYSTPILLYLQRPFTIENALLQLMTSKENKTEFNVPLFI